jgi:starch phosphorylase
VQKDNELQEAIEKIADGTFSNGDKELFSPLLDVLMHKDPYMLCADYRSYVDCQQQADIAYRDADGWSKKSILNVARMGKFSSDRAIREYCQGIWHVDPIEVTLDDDED